MKDNEFPFPIDQYDEEVQRGKDLDLGFQRKQHENDSLIEGDTFPSNKYDEERTRAFSSKTIILAEPVKKLFPGLKIDSNSFKNK